MLNIIKKRFTKTDSSDIERQEAFAELGFRVQVKNVDLGFEGCVDEIQGNLQIILSYTARDGIFVNIKDRNPWRVLFEYADGAHFVNDSDPASFEEMMQSLESLRRQNQLEDNCAVYDRVERIVLNWLSNRRTCVDEKMRQDKE